MNVKKRTHFGSLLFSLFYASSLLRPGRWITIPLNKGLFNAVIKKNELKNNELPLKYA